MAKLILNSGFEMPAIGLGTYKMSNEEAEDAVAAALRLGYRHIDTASYYGNEEGVGKGIAKSGIPRDKIFVTSKIWNDEHDDPRAALKRSLKRLGLSYLDLYLIHWPVKERNNTWKEFEKFKKEGLVRSIGISNFMIKHLKGFLPECSIRPAVNQFELHPFNYPREVVDYCQKRGIHVTAYSPLTRGLHFGDEPIKGIAAAHNKTPAQVQLAWIRQHKCAAIPKSTHEQRMRDNLDIDFELTKDEMEALDNTGISDRVAPDPSQFD